ncbi:MAG: NhaA family Na+:H+ antiporter [Cellvibrionaceae bacterium]|jgi:NhaA family Na+:H+ antiporter
MNQPIIAIKKLLHHKAAPGTLLMIAAVLAIIVANTPLRTYYNLLVDTPVFVAVGALEIQKPLLLWVNDGLMTLFFLLVGLELKREFLDGELSDRNNIILPGVGAIGGMLFPALIYIAFNKDNPEALRGWAIPAATDIAFALGILTLLGSRVPTSLKVFLTSLAIFDDIGAIVIIAIFYTSSVSPVALLVCAACIVILFFMNRSEITKKRYYLIIGFIMWVAMLKSGVHATLTGVILAMFIPLHCKKTKGSPLKKLEHELHSLVSYIILPIFAFCNAGIYLLDVGLEQILHPVPLGIALGLFFGKQVGIFGLCSLAIKMGWARFPFNMSWLPLFGVACLCGVGFTMSLFIGSLAFEGTGINQVVDERLGILLGSLFSGILGYLVLRVSLKGKSSV